MKKKEFNKTLGNLEAEIMEVVWDLKSASVRDVLNIIKKRKKIAYTTIMTVMSRLSDKKILKRKLKNDAYIYTPVQDRQSFLNSVSKKIIRGLINEFGEDIAVAQFMDILENSDLKKSKELRRKLRTIIK